MENIKKNEPSQKIALTRELMSNTLVNEVVRVMLSSPTLKKAIDSYFLGIMEITKLKKVGLFKIDPQSISLKADVCMGLPLENLLKLNLSLDFMSGEYPDAIFLNKHIIVDPVEMDDPFSQIDCKSYVMMPIVSRITEHCWEKRNCGKTECPCYEGHNPYCWSVAGAALDTEAETEDERRMVCINCSQFKVEALLWLDTSDLSGGEVISGESIGHLTGLNRHMGMLIESFKMYDKLSYANEKLADNNEVLQCLNNELKNTHEKIEQELDHAKSIQSSLIPTEYPGNLHKDVAARYIPEGKVGGDYYDVFVIDDHLLGIIMADVSGHGIAAALIMSMFKVLLKTFSPMLRDPMEVLQKINDTFIKETNSTSFVTVFYATFNTETRELCYSNAGHNPQILLNGDQPLQCLNSNGMFVGILEDVNLEKDTLILESPARLVMYTDGITETKNNAGVMFELENVTESVLATQDKSCAEAIEHLMTKLNTYREDQTIKDDVTALVIDL